MNFPVLSVITFTPMVAALIILMLPSGRRNETRAVALMAATFALILSVWMYFSYDQAAAGYQFVERYNWLPALGISLHFGVDGMSAPLVLLTGVVMFTGVLISWGDEDPHVKAGIQDRPREFFAFLFILASGVFGVFVSLDLFMLFFFYEIAVFPMYLLIAIWGWVVTREYAAMKLTLYLFVGSVVSLVGVLVMYWVQYQNTGILSFDMLAMEKAGFSQVFQNIWFLPVFLGFAVLGGIWPFHNWSPDGHVAAPTAVSMFHAGVLMKLGAFAALRVGIMLLPQGAQTWSWLIMAFAAIAVVYGAYIAFVQMDLKYMIGFSSVSHMGLVMLGFSTLNQQGLTGAGMQMFAHAYDPRTRRHKQGHAVCRDRLHHRRARLDGYAGFLRLRGGVPDLHGCVGQSVAGCRDRQHFHRHHGGVYHAQYPTGVFRRDARKARRSRG
jgi:NADH-quinone oxidoreductase subunit M